MATSLRSDLALLYRRAGFGLRPDELDGMVAEGYEAAVERLMGGLGDAPDPPADSLPAPRFSAGPPAGRAIPAAGPATAGPGPAAEAVRNRAVAADLAGLQQWWVDRMVATSTPLREKLTLFWHGHFATAMSKVRDARLMYLQNQLFRRAGSGGFEALVRAVAEDGAMMVWLDTSTDKKSHPNENFAREMLELFTLGIGYYTQDDVTAGARAFTGWTYDRSAYRYRFRAAQHDDGVKTYLGQTGDWNGGDAVRIAVTRPESARFVVAALWSHFAYPVTPADPVVTDLLAAYGPGLDIAAVLRALLLHPAFRSPAARGGLVKQPVEYLAGVARTLGAVPSLPRLAAALGQDLFDPPNVGGWGQNGYWLSTATSQLRLRIALAVAERADLSPVADLPPGQRVSGVARLLSVDGWGPTTAGALARVAGDPVQLTALALVSPEYVLA